MSGARCMVAIAVVTAAMGTAACGGAPAVSRGRAPTLRSPAELGADFMVRQHIEVRYGQRSAGFDAVLQKRGDTLLLVALTPFGTRAFVLEQRGTVVQLTSYVSQELPFPPRYILFDVHRTAFQALEGRPPDSGEREGVQNGERVWERWTDGRLLERRFTRLDRRPPEPVRVVYEGGMAQGRWPAVVRLSNERFGYRLIIRTEQGSP